MRISILTTNPKSEDKKTFFTGKIIDDTFYREFNFSTAVLWQNKEVSIDKRVFDYLAAEGIKKIVFTDTGKGKSYEISIKKFDNHKRVADYGEMKQCYLHKSWLKELPALIKTPYVKAEKLIDSNFVKDIEQFDRKRRSEERRVGKEG